MNVKGKKIAVTGATGFIGRYIVRELQAQGAIVIGVVRNPDRVPELKEQGVELRKADLNNTQQLIEGFKGVDVVVANAALFKATNTNWEAHNKANIEGLQNTFDAMHQVGVKRIIHISSMAVYSGGSEPVITESRRQWHEKSKKRPWTVYSISKALSEQLAWRLAKEYNIEMTALRPGAVYGAFDENFTRYMKLFFSGVIGVNVKGIATRLVYAGDVARAVSLALENDVSVGKAYNLISEDRIELSELRRMWKEAGGPLAPITIPLWLPASSSTSRASIDAAKQDLHWSNRPVIEALKETFELESTKK